MIGLKFTEREKDLLVNLIVESVSPEAPEVPTKISGKDAAKILTKIFTHTE